MIPFARYDGRKRLKGSFYLSIAMSILAVIVIWVYPSFSEGFRDIDEELLGAYPDPMLTIFDIRTMATLEGFLAFEMYIFGFMILLGLYLAYLAAGIVAEDVEHGRMDMLLAMPISRPRLLAERFLALAVPIVVVNAIVAPVILVGAWAVGESIGMVDLVAIHLLFVPYLFACAGIGIVCSVVFDRASIAQRVALGVTFGLFLFESLISLTDFEDLGAIAPMRYVDPNAVLLDSEYDLIGAAILTAMTLAMVLASQWWFSRKDV